MSPKTKKKNTKIGKIDLNIIYILLILFFVLYIIFQSSPLLSLLFGAGVFFTIIIVLVMEFINGFKESGLKKNIVEIALALIFVIAFWLILEFLLKTPIPLDVVPSCSMLPHLQRGDLVILQGVTKTN
ncbi:MAG: hypothetical protein ACP5RI_04090, partial [Candidatus Micrarchaeia archaeon]